MWLSRPFVQPSGHACILNPDCSSQIQFDHSSIQVHGWGESCPLGSAYLPAFAKGTRAGLAELAPALLGQDPTELLKLNEYMDAKMKGHNYGESIVAKRASEFTRSNPNPTQPNPIATVKAVVDMACWDILGS